MLPVDNNGPAEVMPLPVRGHFRGDRSDIFPDKGHPLAVMHLRDHVAIGLHTHDFVELVVVLGGQALHLTGDASYPLTSGDSFVIRPGFAHGYAGTSKLELCSILFDPAGLAMPRDDFSRLPGYHALFDLEPSFRDAHRFRSRLFLAPAARQQVMNWVNLLEDELRARRDGYRHLTLALLIRIIGFLSRSYNGMTSPTSRPLLAVNEAVSHIEHHYSDALRLAELARLAHMSERTLERYFLQAFGVAPVEYLNRLRVAKACQLLGDCRLNITEVADAVGLTDSSYFARVFRQFTGTTPSAFRHSSFHMQAAMQPLHLGRHSRQLPPKTRTTFSRLSPREPEHSSTVTLKS